MNPTTLDPNRVSPSTSTGTIADVTTSPSVLKRVSWGAIFAGAAIASVAAIWLNLLGVAIGLAAYEPVAQQATGFGIGGILWILGTSIVSLFLGGWVTGRLTGTPRRLDRALHGVVAWSLATLFGLYLLTSGASKIIAGTASALSDLAGALPAVGQVVPQVDLPPEITQDLQSFVQEARNDPQLRSSVMDVITGNASQRDRQRLVQELASRTELTEVQIEQKLNTWEQRVDQFGQTVAAQTEGAATALSGVAFLGVASMFLGLGSAALGAIASDPTRRQSGSDRSRRDPTASS